MLRQFAAGLDIERDRRDELIAFADVLLQKFAESHDVDWLAEVVVSLCRSGNEIRFFSHAFSHFLKNDYGASWGNRAMIRTQIENRCAAVLRRCRETMSCSRAQEIVYSFLDVVIEGAAIVSDEDLRHIYR